MGFDVSHALDGAASWLCSSRLVSKIISNPIFTALLITALAMVVIMGVYHYCMRQGGWKKTVRMAIYLMMVISAVVFVHHYAVMARARNESLQAGVRSVFKSISDQGVSGSGEHPVTPGGSEGPSTYPAGANRPVIGGAHPSAAATGGECPCKGAPVLGSSPAAFPAQRSVATPVPADLRPDNVALGDDDFIISDVVVPSTRPGL